MTFAGDLTQKTVYFYRRTEYHERNNGKAMGLLLALLIGFITLATMYHFFVKTWWFPPFISEYGAAYDDHFMLTLVIVGVIFFFSGR